MNAKLSQDAADALQGYMDAAKRDFERHKDGQKPLGPSWKPVMTEQEKQAQQQYIIDNNLPF